MEEIMDILIKLIGSLAGVAVVYAAKALGAYMTQLRENKKIDKLVTSAVKAAEQLFKKEDEDGQIRLNYVQNILIEAGYDLTDAIMAEVESRVFDLNEAQKKK